MQTIEFDIGAGETKTFQIGGAYLEVLAAGGKMNIDLMGPTGAVESAKGAESGAWMRESFSWFQITSTIVQRIKLMITSREGGSRRHAGDVTVTGGQVGVLGGQLDTDPQVIAESGRAFIGTVQQSAPAGNYPRLQLWNKSADKRLLVDQILIYVSERCAVMLSYSTAGAANTNGAALVNKVTGQPVSAAAELRHDFPAATVTGFYQIQFDNPGQYLMKLEKPIVVMPGHGLDLLTNVQDMSARAGFEWYERG